MRLPADQRRGLAVILIALGWLFLTWGCAILLSWAAWPIGLGILLILTGWSVAQRTPAGTPP